MRRDLKWYGALGLIVVLGLFAVVKTKEEVKTRTADRWTGANRIEADRLLNEWNPDLLVPNARDIIDGNPVKPLAKPERPTIPQ